MCSKTSKPSLQACLAVDCKLTGDIPVACIPISLYSLDLEVQLLLNGAAEIQSTDNSMM